MHIPIFFNSSKIALVNNYIILFISLFKFYYKFSFRTLFNFIIIIKTNNKKDL